MVGRREAAEEPIVADAAAVAVAAPAVKVAAAAEGPALPLPNIG